MTSSQQIVLCMLGCAALLACADTGPEHVRIPVFFRGSDASELRVEGGTYTLTRADVALGPLYFCAASGADAELCEASVAEFTGTGVVDALNGAETKLFELSGVTASVRSALYDYGVSWFNTEQAPEPKTKLGHSAVLEGVLTLEDREIRFVANVDVEPRTRGGFAVFGQPTSHEISEGDRLLLRLDPYRWLRPINIDTLVELAGDSDELRIEPGTQAYEALLQGMQNRAPLGFDWE